MKWMLILFEKENKKKNKYATVKKVKRNTQ